MAKILVVGCMCVVFSLMAAAESILPVLGEFRFSEEQKQNRYFKDIAQWAEQDRNQAVDEDTVLCIGSSSFKGWHHIKTDLAPLNIIHRGFGGSTMGDVLVWENFFLRYRSNTVLIYEGDNDMVNPKCSPEDLIGYYKKFCDAILKTNPKTHIYIVSIKPSIARLNLWTKMKKANELLARFAETHPNITYIDVSSKMLDKEGNPREELLAKDKLHMSRQGYVLWTEIIRDVIM